MRSLARTLTSIGLSLAVTLPTLLDAGAFAGADGLKRRRRHRDDRGVGMRGASNGEHGHRADRGHGPRVVRFQQGRDGFGGHVTGCEVVRAKQCLGRKLRRDARR